MVFSRRFSCFHNMSWSQFDYGCIVQGADNHHNLIEWMDLASETQAIFDFSVHFCFISINKNSERGLAG